MASLNDKERHYLIMITYD